MSTKKNKLLESAQKNILKGQLDRAITDYRQIIELDPSDLRHRQRIAELLSKAKRNDEAAKEYASIAKHYIDSDHYVKAIAVYKQIQKLDPLNADISLTLASLNEKQGLIGNATTEYASAVQIFEKNGENFKALKALESILALDACNSAVRLRLAEKYFATGSEKKSSDIFVSLLEDLKERNDETGFNHISERAVNILGDEFSEILRQIGGTDTAQDSQLEISPPPPSLNLDYLPETKNIEPEITDIPSGLKPEPDPSDSLPYKEADYIEDILLLDEDGQEEDSTYSVKCDEWEEDIEFPSFDSSFEPDEYQNADEEVLEELDAVEELDEIELELEIDGDLLTESDVFSAASSSQAEDAFDLGNELSIFADEIDLDIFGEQDQTLTFDITNAGFKKSDLDSEDAESHYSLGLAYKEMGLLNEAIGEFIVASRSSDRKIDALILQGVCLREIGSVAKAVEMLSGTLEDERITEDEYLGIQYELALCHEASGNFNEARSILTDIISARPTFSDVATRLKNLAT